MELILRIFILGVLATFAIDLWAFVSNKILSTPKANWAMVGRWIGHMPSGKFMHESISVVAPITNELLLGWIFHYLIGLAYAVVYVLLVYMFMEGKPSFLSAWVFGVVTIVSPWFIMQPGLGMGVCARKMEKASLIRIQNLVIHSIFGVALYCAWLVANLIL